MVQQQPVHGNNLGADLAAKMATKTGLDFVMRVSKMKAKKHRQIHPTQSQGQNSIEHKYYEHHMRQGCEKNKYSVLNRQGQEDPQVQICKGNSLAEVMLHSP